MQQARAAAPPAFPVIGPTELALAAENAGLGGQDIHFTSLDRPGGAATVQSGRPMYPASMIKTPLAVATAAAVERGRLRWTDRIEPGAGDMTPNDAPSPLQPGYAASVEELVELMLARSDNVATNVLIDAVDRAEATRTLQALGFRETAVRRKLSGALPLLDDPRATGRNAHSSSDAAELFRRIARGDVPGAQRIYRALAVQHWNTKLSAGLEPGDRFAHKTGDTDEWSHDGGILTLPGGARYVVVVYTGLPSGGAEDRRFGAFMRALRARLPGD